MVLIYSTRLKLIKRRILLEMARGHGLRRHQIIHETWYYFVKLAGFQHILKILNSVN